MPCVGRSTRLKVIGSPFGSVATSVPVTLVSSRVSVAELLCATGAVAASCVTVTVCDATTRVPVRAAPALGATVKVTVPLADPPAGGLMVIHGVEVEASVPG